MEGRSVTAAPGMTIVPDIGRNRQANRVRDIAVYAGCVIAIPILATGEQLCWVPRVTQRILWNNYQRVSLVTATVSTPVLASSIASTYSTPVLASSIASTIDWGSIGTFGTFGTALAELCESQRGRWNLRGVSALVSVGKGDTGPERRFGSRNPLWLTVR